MISVNVNDSGAQAVLDVAGAVPLSLRPLMARLGKQGEVETRAHFRERNLQPNAKGWPKKNFWEREGARNTALTSITNDSATVTIASAAIAHKLEGGTITPKRGRALAIPLTAAAYAAGSPREWDDSRKLFHPKGTNFLAIRDTNSRAGIYPQYLLVPSVTQDADPDTLPRMDALSAKLAASAQAWLDRQLRGTSA